jgi:hypothetical protein
VGNSLEVNTEKFEMVCDILNNSVLWSSLQGCKSGEHASASALRVCHIHMFCHYKLNIFFCTGQYICVTHDISCVCVSVLLTSELFLTASVF